MLTALSAVQPIGDLSPRESAEWRHLQASVVTLMQDGVPQGDAALIDASGLFIVHRSQVQTPLLDGVTSDGRPVQLSAVSYDPVSHLELLQATGWRRDYGRPLRIPVGDEEGHGVVFAVLPTGPIRAVFTGLHRTGFMHSERRILPFNEVRFELPPQACAGAILIDGDGELLGVLGATLSAPNADQRNSLAFGGRRMGGNANPGTTSADAPPVERASEELGANRLPVSSAYAAGEGPGSRIAATTPRARRPRRMGPSQMTVAYSVGNAVIRRVVLGFLSSDHRVDYPSIGVLCRDSGEGGSFIQQIEPSSPAEAAGLQIGDLILSIEGEKVRNQVEFALVMLNQSVGSTIQIRIRRAGRTFTREALVSRG